MPRLGSSIRLMVKGTGSDKNFYETMGKCGQLLLECCQGVLAISLAQCQLKPMVYTGCMKFGHVLTQKLHLTHYYWIATNILICSQSKIDGWRKLDLKTLWSDIVTIHMPNVEVIALTSNSNLNDEVS
ncbi:hypothetical protein L2E82_52944 [Cichorium intybus]|nr:hypothetical protein L2E82_52944 [Cichorium intybus]